ncbi:hypothetical protein [Archangium violaceum]|uniref:hypothetical protein n=1 Tax=Archangium violaceum TaxID=83451 RepID=UPI0036DEEE42
MMHDKSLTPEARALAEKTFSKVVAWTTTHGLEATPAQVAALGEDLAITMALRPPTGNADADATSLFAAALTGIDRVWGAPRAADPWYWRVTMAGVGGEVMDALVARGGYPAPAADTRKNMSRALLKRARGLVALAHRFDPETAAQKMREHAAAVVDVYLGPPPASQMLN